MISNKFGTKANSQFLTLLKSQKDGCLTYSTWWVQFQIPPALPGPCQPVQNTCS